MNRSGIVSFLHDSVGAFRQFPRERLESLVDGSQVRSFEANEFILHQGDEAKHFGVAIDGVIDVSIMGEGAARRSLGQVAAGETFNELALMTGDAIPADFIAKTRCDVLLIPVSLFQSVIVAEPNASQHLSRTIASRMKSVLSDPQSAAAVTRGVEDPYGLQLKSERPEKILVINCGSSSLKYTFYNTADEAQQARGLVERIGIAGTRHKHHGRGVRLSESCPRPVSRKPSRRWWRNSRRSKPASSLARAMSVSSLIGSCTVVRSSLKER